MTNTAKFNRQLVIEKACQLFWLKGYSATSTRDLQQAIDMRPGSIYAAFGSKQGLYIESLKFYSKSMGEKLDQCLIESETILDGMQAFVTKILIGDKDAQASKICMLIKTNIELCENEPELLKLNQELLIQFEQFIEDLFTQVLKKNELSSNQAPIDLARMFLIQFTGLRSYLKWKNDKTLSHQLIEQMFQKIKNM